jgi:hypothetical protein
MFSQHCIASNWSKNVSLIVLFGSNCNSCAVNAVGYSSQYRDTVWAKEIKKNWDNSECCVPRKSFHIP